MRFRPVEVLILTFPGERIDPLAVEALRGVVDMGDVTLLDVVFASREPNGDLRVVDFADGAMSFGFDGVEVCGKSVVSDEDIATVAEELESGSSAAMLVFENTWVHRLSETIRSVNGHVAVNVLMPSDLRSPG